MPAPFNTASYTWPRLIGHNVLSTSGIFGVPLDVAATYIILFTIYGAVLGFSGASKFFLDISFAAFGKSRAGPGRAVTVAGFLLGTVSGSGVATTITLGGVSWPILRRANYPREDAGGVLAAAGIGAILSPPTLGAAAFLIAEYLRVSYLEVLIWATIPTLLYYLGIVLAIEMDARRFRTRAVGIEAEPAGRLLLRYGYHFSSLIAIVVFLWFGMSAFRAVVLATALQFVLAFLDRRHWWTPKRVWDALAAGAVGALAVVPVMAAAGIIVGVMTLTGLGLKLAGIIVDLAGANLVLTAAYSAVAILLLGLAVPVTASFIIAWVVISPALRELGVPDYAAGMFIFYYAVLAEVSPPIALSPFAAAAITGGKAVKTMWLTLKYTLPAFLVPFVFVLAPAGRGVAARRRRRDSGNGSPHLSRRGGRAGRRHRGMARRSRPSSRAGPVRGRRGRNAGDDPGRHRDRRRGDPGGLRSAPGPAEAAGRRDRFRSRPGRPRSGRRRTDRRGAA